MTMQCYTVEPPIPKRGQPPHNGYNVYPLPILFIHFYISPKKGKKDIILFPKVFIIWRFHCIAIHEIDVFMNHRTDTGSPVIE